MSDSDDRPVPDRDDGRITCPVCQAKSLTEAIEADLMVLSCVEAFLQKDEERLKLLMDGFTAYDAHAACSLLATTIASMCAMVGRDMQEAIDDFRSDLNAQLATEG